MTDETLTRCPRCGAVRRAEAAFCSKCGARIKTAPFDPFVGQPATPPPPTTPPHKSAGKKAAAWLGVAAVMLIGGGLRGILLNIAHHPHQYSSLFHNPFSPRLLATSLRLYQQGDSWEYRVSGTASMPSGQTGTITDGTLKSAITGLTVTDFNNLTQTNDINLSFSLNGETHPFSHSERQVLSQNRLGTTYLTSDDDGPQGRTRVVRQPQVDTPGVWSVMLNQFSHLDFDDGESREETTVVNGTEVVDTVLGRLTVWRCTQDEADSDGTKTATTLWFAPQLGMPVRTSGTTTLPDGLVLTLTTELTKTSVPL